MQWKGETIKVALETWTWSTSSNIKNNTISSACAKCHIRKRNKCGKHATCTIYKPNAKYSFTVLYTVLDLLVLNGVVCISMRNGCWYLTNKVLHTTYKDTLTHTKCESHSIHSTTSTRESERVKEEKVFFMQKLCFPISSPHRLKQIIPGPTWMGCTYWFDENTCARIFVELYQKPHRIDSGSKDARVHSMHAKATWQIFIEIARY